MPIAQYLQIAEWTAEQLLASGTDPPPLELESLLRAKELDPLSWTSAVDNFADWFHHAVGRASHLTDVLQRRDRRWIHRIARCRDAFTVSVRVRHLGAGGRLRGCFSFLQPGGVYGTGCELEVGFFVAAAC